MPARKHLDRILPVLLPSGIPKRCFNLFFDTPRSLFAHNLSKVYGGATLVREISPEIRMRCRKNVSRPGNLPKYPDERREITLSSGLSPQKREPRAQSSVGEPSGFAHRHCFESMAVVFAIDGACLPAGVRLAYSPHAISLEYKLSKHIHLLLTLLLYGLSGSKSGIFVYCRS